ncbi:MAG: hypothetical protein U0Q03_22155 [Acidimicrobiales bacterium]
MLDLKMTSVSGCATVRVSGALSTVADGETLAEAIGFVPIDDHLVIDLRHVVVLEHRAAEVLAGALVQRLVCAETVVVSDRPEVTMQLVLADADRLAPLVADLHQAHQVIRARSGMPMDGFTDGYTEVA